MNLTPTYPPDDAPPIRTQADLETHWRDLLEPLGFSEELLWMLMIDADDQITPFITQTEGLPDRPDDEVLDSMLRMCAELLADLVPGGSVAFLLSQPGQAGVGEREVAWARALHTAAARHEVPLRPIHLADDRDLRAVAPDDLAA